MKTHEEFLNYAADLATKSVKNSGGPFAAIVVKKGVVVAEGTNKVTLKNDPTNHAEIDAIRSACKKLNSFELKDCIMYTSCEPCPMCFGAIYWSRVTAVYYAATKKDAAEAGFDDSLIYSEINKKDSSRKIKFIKLNVENATKSFDEWRKKEDRIDY